MLRATQNISACEKNQKQHCYIYCVRDIETHVEDMHAVSLYG